MDYPIKTVQQLRPILVGFRKQAGLSQAALASLLGVTQQSYAKIEANPSATSVERLFTILRLLGSEIVLTHAAKNPSAIPANTNEQLHVTASPKPVPATEKPRQPAPPKMVPPSKKQERW
jgi:HTH-type transcriptional regulator/antitoxin HipB